MLNKKILAINGEARTFSEDDVRLVMARISSEKMENGLFGVIILINIVFPDDTLEYWSTEQVFIETPKNTELPLAELIDDILTHIRTKPIITKADLDVYMQKAFSVLEAQQ